MTLKFYVKNQTLVYCGKDTVASGSKNYLYAAFRFTKEWAGLAKTAVFVSADGERRYHMIIEGGRCSVPAEMIAEGGFYVSVFGGDRITSTQVYIDVEQSGVEPGLTPPEPTEDVYNQILEKVTDVALGLETLYVTGGMIADGAVSEEKLDKAVTAKLHSHTNKDALDNFNLYMWGELNNFISDKDNLITRAHTVGEFRNEKIQAWHDFTFEIGELFELYNETEADISRLHYNDEAVWEFSQTLEAGKAYLMRIVSKPVTGADYENGVIEVIRETYLDKDEYVLTQMYDTICDMSVQIKELSDADDILSSLLEEGV